MNTKSFWPNHKFAAITIAVLLTGAISLYGLWLSGFRVNLTPSLPLGVYRLSGEAARKGGLAAFCLDVSNPFSRAARERGYLASGACPSGLRPLLKTVAGLPGDHVKITPEALLVNGEALANSARLERDQFGREVPPSLLITGRIPAGFALVVSQEHAGSFDSRYFGLVPMSSLKTVKPVLLF
ncbi:MAG: conjugative transfer signal peptidase TraF [Candidatus Adiutrix sp.]|nr:conjugative transfer signal peptidase TraF [Candidatus Adiutrix sp.]